MKSFTSIILLLLFTISTSKVVKFKVPENLKKAKITVKENTVFDLRLQGNPSTGFSWFVLNEDELKDYDLTCLDLEGDIVYENEQAEMVGMGGEYSFKFNSGSASDKNKVIKFVYKTYWGKSDDDQYLTIYVKVKN